MVWGTDTVPGSEVEWRNQPQISRQRKGNGEPWEVRRTYPHTHLPPTPLYRDLISLTWDVITAQSLDSDWFKHECGLLFHPMRSGGLWQQQKEDFGKEFLDFRRKEKNTVPVEYIMFVGWNPSNHAGTTTKASKGQSCHSEAGRMKKMETLRPTELSRLDWTVSMSCLLGWLTVLLLSCFCLGLVSFHFISFHFVVSWNCLGTQC